MPVASSVLAGGELAAAAKLLHGFCFEPVELPLSKLDYEPRASFQCKEPGCAALWIASKSGSVMRIELPSRDKLELKQTVHRGDREARAIFHVHDGAPFGAPGQGVLLIGRDNGVLEIVPDQDWSESPRAVRRAPRKVFHLDTWYRDRKDQPVSADDRIARDRTASLSYTEDITAVAVLPRAWQPGAADIVVATRYPWLYVIEIVNGKMQLRHRLGMPGWIQWILGSQPGDGRITCISRGGDIVRFTRRQLASGRRWVEAKLSLLPTAAMAFDRGSVLLGTTTGLFLVRDDRDEATAVPVTRSPVLCLARAQVGSDDDPDDYITMGLENRRLHVIHAELLRALAYGDERPAGRDHNFAIEMADAVLEVQTLRVDAGPSSGAYVLAALRDHSVRLFHVINQHTQRQRVKDAWQSHARALPGTSTERPIETELHAVAMGPPGDCDPDAWKFMVVDEVLPRLCEDASRGERQRIVRLACRIARNADRPVLYRLSVAMERLTDNRIDLLLRLSRALLRGVPHGDEHRWTAFIDFHLRVLTALSSKLDEPGRARLVSWTRFVRKYVLLGNTFATKQFELGDLVERNYKTRKYLDALIYQTRLVQRGYDLRWIASVDGEVSELHAVNCRLQPGDDNPYLVVVAVTTDGGLAFLDGSSGDRLQIQRGNTTRRVFNPFEAAWDPLAGEERRPARTLASAVAHHNDRLRIVLSCTAPNARPWLAVIDVRWSGPPTTPVVIESIARIERVKPLPMTPTGTGNLEPIDPPRVFAVQPLPGHPNKFVVGLESQTCPVGLLHHGTAGWTLELARDSESPGSHGPRRVDDPRLLTSGEVSTRALAVIAIDDQPSRYLAVAGSDDGLVRAISFGAEQAAATWEVKRWDRVTAAVTSIALGRHDELSPHADRSGSTLSCYLGTAAGDTFALAIRACTRSGAGAAPPFGDHQAEPLWRDTQDGAIGAVRLWHTPLYKENAILVAASEKGWLHLYNHAPRRGDLQKDRVSASFNYVFRGMRFDRIELHDRLRALAIIEGGRELVAARPGGQIYLATLVYLRDSDDRRDPEPAPPAGKPGRELPREMWQRLHHLFAASQHDWLDRNRERPELPKLDLFDLVRVGGGALSSYVLRRRLRFHDRWTQREPAQLRVKAQRLLHRLDPENPEHAERIKVILRSLCRTFLFQDPSELRKAILVDPETALDGHAETAEVCELVAGYLTGKLAYSRRLRSVAIKELLRVAVLWHMARPEHGDRVREAVKAALYSCLRDDDRLVRFEALRALSVMLRNVGVMVDVAAEPRRTLIRALLPQELGSLSWALELVVTGLQQLPGFTRRTALVGSAWYHVSALLPLFRIFPDRTLTLCDYLIRAGLGLRVVAMCYQLLRHQGAEIIRKRIENLYLMPVLAPQYTREAYIERHDRQGAGHQHLREEMRLVPSPGSARPWHDHAWHEIDDAMMAERRISLLHKLARMWSVKQRDQIHEIATFEPAPPLRPDAPIPRDTPLGDLERVVGTLAGIAASLKRADTTVRAFELLEDLGGRHGWNIDGRSALTAPMRSIVTGIVTAWRNVYDPPPARERMEIGGYLLGRELGKDRFGTVFALDESAAPAARRVIKVLRDLRSVNAAERFLEGAQINQLLWERSPDKRYVVEVPHIYKERPYLAYVMPWYPDVLLSHLVPGFQARPEALRWTETVALHIGRALRAAHALGHYHGNVKASNILFDADPTRDLVFRLADFRVSWASREDGGPTESIRVVPECLSQKYPSDPGEDPVRRRQWDDLAALSLILYRMLTGTVIGPATTNLDALDMHIQRLDKLASRPEIKSGKRTLRIVATLKRVFTMTERDPILNIDRFLDSLEPAGAIRPGPRAASQARARLEPTAAARAATPDGQPEVPVLFLSANPSDTTPTDVTREVAKIDRRLKGTRYRDVYRFVHVFEAKAEDLEDRIQRHRPRIVHVSAHGTAENLLALHGADDQSDLQSIEVFAKVFEILGGVDCVVLSACYTDALARKICASVPVVIGMSAAIRNDEAIAFGGSFYGALGHGRDVKAAFELGRNAVLRVRKTAPDATREAVRAGAPRAKGRRPAATATRTGRGQTREVAVARSAEAGHEVLPVLHTRDGFDASTLRFVEPDPTPASQTSAPATPRRRRRRRRRG